MKEDFGQALDKVLMDGKRPVANASKQAIKRASTPPAAIPPSR
jgi:hypothetical protein